MEKLISYCISKNTKALSEHLSLQLPETISIDESVAILNGTGYFDLRNTQNLIKLSKKILVQKYNPFIYINKNNCKIIDEFYTIRNYIAHKSKSSARSLMNMYKINYGFNEFHEPGKFFLMYDASSKELKFDYFNSYMLVFTLAVLEMWEYLFPKSFTLITDKDGSFSPQSMIRLKKILRFRKPNK